MKRHTRGGPEGPEHRSLWCATSRKLPQPMQFRDFFMARMIKSLAMGNKFDLQLFSPPRRRGDWGLSEGKASNMD